MTAAEVSGLTRAEGVARLIVAYGDILRAYEEIYNGPAAAAHASREYIICRRTRERLVRRQIELMQQGYGRRD